MAYEVTLYFRFLYQIKYAQKHTYNIPTCMYYVLYILHFFVRSNRIQLVFDIDVWRIWKCLLLDLYSKSKLHNLHSYLFWVSCVVLCKVVLEGCVSWPLVYYSKSPRLIRMTILVAKLQYFICVKTLSVDFKTWNSQNVDLMHYTYKKLNKKQLLLLELKVLFLTAWSE